MDIEGLKEFENTVKGVINTAQEYKNLKKRVHNQRKALNEKQNAINDYKASLKFDSQVMALHDQKVRELTNTVDCLDDKNQELVKNNKDLFKRNASLITQTAHLRTRNRVLKKHNAHNKGKLIALNHVLNRGGKIPRVELR